MNQVGGLFHRLVTISCVSPTEVGRGKKSSIITQSYHQSLWHGPLALLSGCREGELLWGRREENHQPTWVLDLNFPWTFRSLKFWPSKNGSAFNSNSHLHEIFFWLSSSGSDFFFAFLRTQPSLMLISLLLPLSFGSDFPVFTSYLLEWNCWKVTIKPHASWYVPEPGPVPGTWLCATSADWWMSNLCNRAGVLSQPSSSKKKKTHLRSFPGTHDNEHRKLAG